LLVDRNCCPKLSGHVLYSCISPGTVAPLHLSWHCNCLAVSASIAGTAATYLFLQALQLPAPFLAMQLFASSFKHCICLPVLTGAAVACLFPGTVAPSIFPGIATAWLFLQALQLPASFLALQLPPSFLALQLPGCFFRRCSCLPLSWQCTSLHLSWHCNCLNVLQFPAIPACT